MAELLWTCYFLLPAPTTSSATGAKKSSCTCVAEVVGQHQLTRFWAVLNKTASVKRTGDTTQNSKNGSTPHALRGNSGFECRVSKNSRFFLDLCFHFFIRVWQKWQSNIIRQFKNTVIHQIELAKGPAILICVLTKIPRSLRLCSAQYITNILIVESGNAIGYPRLQPRPPLRALKSTFYISGGCTGAVLVDRALSSSSCLTWQETYREHFHPF